jgi:2-polyprenyl-3-methyl-5-hydroxy-6-metoxy-1,4-benzoquinol methylase
LIEQINTQKIFVLGNQKSGTTAIAWLIAHYGQLTKTLDIPELWKQKHKIFSGKRTLTSFVRSNSQSFSVQLIKEPNLTFFYREIDEIFPDSRYVFVIRHPADNIRSILDRLKIPGHLENAELKIKTRNTWEDLFYGTLLGFLKEEQYIARLAKRWVLSAEMYLKNRDKMLLIRYEDFLADKHRCIHTASQKLGINAKNEIEPFLDLQHQSRGVTRGMPWIECFGERNIEIIRKICGPYLKYFDYELPKNGTVSLSKGAVETEGKTIKKLNPSTEKYWTYSRKDVLKKKAAYLPRHLVVSMIPEQDGTIKVLDVGCTDSILGFLLRKKFKDIYLAGGDISQSSTAFGCHYCDKTFQLDIEKKTLQDQGCNEHFHYIICIELIEHLVNPEIVLKKLKDLLDENGYIIISFRNIAWWRYRMSLLRGYFLDDTSFYHHAAYLHDFTMYTFATLMENAGLEPAEIGGEFIPPRFLRKIIPTNLVEKLITRYPNLFGHQIIIKARRGRC